MLPRLRSHQDFWAAWMFAVIALVFLWVGRDLTMGTARQMGPAYMPRVLCGLMLVAAALLFVRSFRFEGQPLARLTWRPILVVPGAMVVFALALHPLGIVLTVWLTILVASLADRDVRPLEVALTALFLSIFSVALFVKALQLNLPIWPEI